MASFAYFCVCLFLLSSFGISLLGRSLVHLSSGVSELIRVVYIKLFHGAGGVVSFLLYMIGLGQRAVCNFFGKGTGTSEGW